MLSVLWDILCVLKNFAMSILAVLIMALNVIIAALAEAIGGLLTVLPDFPDPLELPAVMEEVLGWINWVFPVGTTLAILGFAAVAWLAWQGVATALRWAKVVE